tara:strand:+ start:8942 stop:9730 length:789 start_codon:yes stop_codon:yes gene_type:complete
MRNIRISQSLIKELNKEGCQLAVKKMLEGERSEPTEAMLNGLYFEHYLIGGTRGGEVPEFKPLKNGNKPKAELDLIDLIDKSKELLTANDIKIDEVQPEYIYEDVVAHLDAVGSVRGEKCLIDIKWTGTREDDKWNGWGEPLMKEDAHIQAKHYVWTYMMATGQHLPFYFIVFGKSGWCKLIRFNCEQSALQEHESVINEARANIKQMIKDKFPYKAHLGLCSKCWYKKTCKSFSNHLEIESFDLGNDLFFIENDYKQSKRD